MKKVKTFARPADVKNLGFNIFRAQILLYARSVRMMESIKKTTHKKIRSIWERIYFHLIDKTFKISNLKRKNMSTVIIFTIVLTLLAIGGIRLIQSKNKSAGYMQDGVTVITSNFLALVPKKVPRKIAKKYTFVNNVNDANKEFLEFNSDNKTICHDCRNPLKELGSHSGYIAIAIGCRVYFMNDNTFLCEECGPPHNYRRNDKGEVVCSDCGKSDYALTYTADDSAVCIGCHGDRCID